MQNLTFEVVNCAVQGAMGDKHHKFTTYSQGPMICLPKPFIFRIRSQVVQTYQCEARKAGRGEFDNNGLEVLLRADTLPYPAGFQHGRGLFALPDRDFVIAAIIKFHPGEKESQSALFSSARGGIMCE